MHGYSSFVVQDHYQTKYLLQDEALDYGSYFNDKNFVTDDNCQFTVFQENKTKFLKVKKS